MTLTKQDILNNIASLTEQRKKLEQSKEQYETMNGSISSVITILVEAQTAINRASTALSTYYMSETATLKVEELGGENTNVENIISNLSNALEISNNKITSIESLIEANINECSRLQNAYNNLNT